MHGWLFSGCFREELSSPSRLVQMSQGESCFQTVEKKKGKGFGFLPLIDEKALECV